jgi:hypothetical protein
LTDKQESGGAVPETASAPDAATRALGELVTAIDDCIDRLTSARGRAQELLAARADGTNWLDIVTAERRPLVVETVSTVMATLARAGSRFRREQAHALQAEHVSINRIAALFGVTRQRISALLHERVADDAASLPG